MSAKQVQVVVPSSPEDRKKIKKVMQEVSDIKTMIEANRDTIKEAIKALSEEYELPVKFLNKMAKTYHAQTYDKEVSEHDDFQALYEQVLNPE